MREFTTSHIIALVVVVIGVHILALSLFLFNTEAENIAHETAVQEVVPYNPLDHTDIAAAAGYVLDVRTGKVLYRKNAHAELPLASLTKLMTALLAHESLDKDEFVTVTPESLNQEGDHGLFPGEQFRAQDLIAFTLVSSSNDGAHALASALSAFPDQTGEIGNTNIITLMNSRSQELGLSNTHFANPTGLDQENASVGGAYGSARDVAQLVNYILQERAELFESTRNNRISVASTFGIMHTAENTNTIVEEIPWLIGSKTGFTDLAGGNLAVVFDVGLGHPVIAVVLGSTKEERFTDIQTLIEGTFEYFSSIENIPQG